jgi:hypothetical protein
MSLHQLPASFVHVLDKALVEDGHFEMGAGKGSEQRQPMNTNPSEFPAHACVSQQAWVILEKENLLDGDNAYWSHPLLHLLDVADQFWREFSRVHPEWVEHLFQPHHSFSGDYGLIGLDLLVKARRMAPDGKGKELLTAYLGAIPTLDLSAKTLSDIAQDTHGFLVLAATGPPLLGLLSEWREELKTGLARFLLERAVPSANPDPGHSVTSRSRL